MSADAADAMPWFTKYVEGLVKSVNVLFHERTRGMQSAQRKPSSAPSSSSASSLLAASRRPARSKRARSSLAVTSCTGRAISGQEAHLDAADRLAQEAANYTEDDFRAPPTVAYPKARENSLYSLLLVDLKGHNSLHARSHRIAWAQHNIPGAAFARGDISSGTVCTPYRPPGCRRGSLHVLVLVFEQRCGAALRDVSPVFAEDCLRLSTWLSRFGAAARRMVVCEEFRAHVQRSVEDPTDSDACSSSSVELEMPTVSFHKLESPKRAKAATTAFVFSEQNGWVPALAAARRADKDCPKRIRVF